MAAKWKTIAPGIRVRDHGSRRHGVRADRYFTLRFSIKGADGKPKQVEEALGWASQGWNLQRAQEELGKLRQAKRTGDGPATLRQRAEAQRRADLGRIEAEERRQRLERNLRELWDRYSAEVIAVQNKPRTGIEKKRLWKRRIEPTLGHLKVRDVTEQDAGNVVRAALRFDEAGRVVGGRAEAGNTYRLLHHLFSRGLAWGWRPAEAGNPLANIPEPRTGRRERLLTSEEVGALLKKLADPIVTAREAPQVIGAIRSALLTGARISELLGLKWDQIRREESELHLPDTKAGFSRRQVSPEVLAVFDSVGRVPGSPFVFRSVKSPLKPLSYNTVEKAFGRVVKAAGVQNCTLHTLRHWYATATANSVSNPRIGMALTGHKSHAAYLTYIHGDRKQAQVLAEKIAALVSRLASNERNADDPDKP